MVFVLCELKGFKTAFQDSQLGMANTEKMKLIFDSEFCGLAAVYCVCCFGPLLLANEVAIFLILDSGGRNQ